MQWFIPINYVFIVYNKPKKCVDIYIERNIYIEVSMISK